MAGGRPRAFDVDVALDRAVELFWRQGYEGTSLSDLTTALGVNRPSLYAAFGNKEELFAKALDRYAAGPGGYAAEALAAPTAREVVERLVHGAVELTTGPRTPPGCLTVQGVHSCAPDSASAREAALVRRMAGETALRRRFEQAPDLPAGHDPATFARLVHTLTDGIAVQAASGRTRDELRQVADLVLHALMPRPLVEDP